MKIFIILLCFFIYGCGMPFGGDKLEPAKPDVTNEKVLNIKDKIAVNTKRIGELGEQIKKSTKEVQTKVDAQEIVIKNKENAEVVQKLVKVEDDLKSLNVQLEELTKENEKLNGELTKSYNKIWLGIFGFNCLILVGAIYLTFAYSQKIGLPIVFGAISIISICYFFSSFAWISAAVGGVLAVGGLAVVICQAIKERKALGEVVGSLESTKRMIWGEEAKAVVNVIQSQSTKELVKTIKGNKGDK